MSSPTNGRPILATFDPDIDVHCTTCGYNLRGTRGTACPECGAGFVLAAPRQIEHYGLYLTALVATAGVAFISQYFLYVLNTLLTDPGNVLTYYGTVETFTYILNLLAVPYLVLLLVFRKRIVRSTIGVQLGWAIPPILFAVLEVGYTVYNVLIF